MMLIRKSILLIGLLCLLSPGLAQEQPFIKESRADYEARMQWWKEARFGMFIHWGLYAIPAGEWNGKTGYGEWIRTSAEIPLEVYDTFPRRFNPIQFNADEWVQMARDAGMKYIVITSKHHDGFCMFDSKQTDFDIMNTPYGKDVMKELSAACKKYGLKFCFYYSIMDWHHPDYLPRRAWEKTRSTEGADRSRYMAYMKAQLKELLTNYGDIGVLWFDGEWEEFWNEKYGKEIYSYCRSFQPDLLINNRVGAGRMDMEGSTKEGMFGGDFGTPEQQIPAKGLPGTYWETCMTMNDHWGYNSHDKNFKSITDLVRMICDIASKGGNYLLNVGPKADGKFPQESIDRLKQLGSWMKMNGEAIYATEASPFEQLSWGRCTQKRMDNGNTRLYLHVFHYSDNGRLVVPGIFNEPLNAFFLADPGKQSLPIQRTGSDLVIQLPFTIQDTICTVVTLDIKGKPDIFEPPVITAAFDIFIDSLEITLSTERENTTIICGLQSGEGRSTIFTYAKPFYIKNTTTVTATVFRDGKPVSPLLSKTFSKVSPWPAIAHDKSLPGIKYSVYKGEWDSIPDFSSISPIMTAITTNIGIAADLKAEYFGYMFEGYIEIPETAVYGFATESDDGSRLYIDNKLVVDNDQLHSILWKEGIAPLEKGAHRIRVDYFEKTGGNELRVFSWYGNQKPTLIPENLLFH